MEKICWDFYLLCKCWGFKLLIQFSVTNFLSFRVDCIKKIYCLIKMNESYRVSRYMVRMQLVNQICIKRCVQLLEWFVGFKFILLKKVIKRVLKIYILLMIFHHENQKIFIKRVFTVKVWCYVSCKFQGYWMKKKSWPKEMWKYLHSSYFSQYGILCTKYHIVFPFRKLLFDSP